MPLSAEERRVLFATHDMVKIINQRGCVKGMADLKQLEINLEKNTREHIWLKGWSYAVATFTAVTAYIVSIMWKKHGG